MKVCCIYKGKANQSELGTFLKAPLCEVKVIELIDETLEVLVESSPDVIVFDVTTSRGEEADVALLSKIQSLTKTVPILLATNNSESSKYRELMLDGGVDGCIQMPFLPEELVLRLKKFVLK